MATDLIGEVPEAFLGLHPFEFIFPSPTLLGEVYSGPPGWLEAQMAIGAMSKLVHAADRAKDSSLFALSWRNYRVGSSAFMCNFETGNMGFLDGFNVKPDSKASSLNLHAEQIAIAKGRAQGLNRVIGITVYADPDNDDANPNKYTTLRPCGRCVEMFKSIPEVTENTLILGTNLDLSECELYTARSLFDQNVPMLVPEPFALVTEDDLTYYDRNIQPYLINPMYEMFMQKTAPE
jgi:cytidine deaminase